MENDANPSQDKACKEDDVAETLDAGKLGTHSLHDASCLALGESVPAAV
jgi:NaMN:DMB phosphoribosyltransferase